MTPGQPAKIVIEVTNQMAKRGGTRNSMNKWTGIQRALTLEIQVELLEFGLFGLYVRFALL